MSFALFQVAGSKASVVDIMRDERVRVVVVLLEVWKAWGCGGLWARNVVVGWKMGC